MRDTLKIVALILIPIISALSMIGCEEDIHHNDIRFDNIRPSGMCKYVGTMTGYSQRQLSIRAFDLDVNYIHLISSTSNGNKITYVTNFYQCPIGVLK